jgi:hypothetical protein
VIARQAAAGRRVVVASRTPRPHAGLWRRWDAAAGLPVPVEGATVVLALAPAPREAPGRLWTDAVPRLATEAWRGGAAAVVVCGPAGEGEAGVDAFARGVARLSAAPRTAVVRFGPLFGMDDRCVWPLVTALREHGVIRLPRGLPPIAPLTLDDAARAVLALAAHPGDRTLLGPERLTTEVLGARIVARFGGRWTWRLWGGTGDVDRLRAWERARDDWDDARLGPRQTVSSWAAKLPGLRRGR